MEKRQQPKTTINEKTTISEKTTRTRQTTIFKKGANKKTRLPPK